MNWHWRGDELSYVLANLEKLVVKEAQGVAKMHEDLRNATEVPEDWTS